MADHAVTKLANDLGIFVNSLSSEIRGLKLKIGLRDIREIIILCVRDDIFSGYL